MAQTFNATKPESGVTTFGELYQIIRDHNDTLRSSFSGAAFPTNPTTGQLCWRTDRGTNGYLYIFTGNTAIGESGWVSNAEASALGLEVINARGSKPTLDQRLDVVLNEDGTLKDGVSVNYSEWVSPPFIFTYLSTNSFSVPDDQTDIYVVGRRLKINLGASVVYSEVIQAEYTTETTVTIANTVLDASLVSVEHSFIKPLEENGSVNASMVGAYSKSETDNTVVKLTGDQTIAGVKTFSSSPIVPTPTTDFQVSTKKYVDSLVPTGVIVLWSGSSTSIPAGWALCDGLNGTPDLRDRFVIGAGGSYVVGSTGGSADAVVVSHTHTTPDHTHTGTVASAGAHTHNVASGDSVGSIIGYDYGTNLFNSATSSSTGYVSHFGNTSSAGVHTHSLTINSGGGGTSGSAGVSGVGKNLPPYYALAYIMKL